jgi:predicted RNA-binding Zn-ribbon protein involved in translation (DUF1610 family)
MSDAEFFKFFEGCGVHFYTDRAGDLAWELEHACPTCGSYVYNDDFEINEHKECRVDWDCDQCGQQFITMLRVSWELI